MKQQDLKTAFKLIVLAIFAIIPFSATAQETAEAAKIKEYFLRPLVYRQLTFPLLTNAK